MDPTMKILVIKKNMGFARGSPRSVLLTFF
jgi:hypothetical protein